MNSVKHLTLRCNGTLFIFINTKSPHGTCIIMNYTPVQEMTIFIDKSLSRFAFEVQFNMKPLILTCNSNPMKLKFCYLYKELMATLLWMV